MATVEIDDFYPYSYQPTRRYGGDRPPHRRIEEILERGRASYARLLEDFLQFSDDFRSIKVSPVESRPDAPHWVNGFFPGLDAIALYGLIATRKPKVFCEIGSGNSTKFAARARSLRSPGTKIVSIDPAPRAEIGKLCDVQIRQPLQECDLSIINGLEAGDILFLDGSHRVLQNSDVAVFFLEILPEVKPGVLIHLHDVFWPFDYPEAWASRMYSEQYILGAVLLASEKVIDVFLPNGYVSARRELIEILDPIWKAPELSSIEPHGGSFWFSKLTS